MNENNMNSCDNNAYYQNNSAKPNFCTNCGAQIPQMQNFCTVCGQPVQIDVSQTQSPININKKTFIEKYAPDNIRRDIKIFSILFYVCAAANLGVAIAANVPSAIIDSVVLVGLTVAMQLTKNKIFSILLVLSIAEIIIGFAISGKMTSYFWLIASIGALSVFRRADKLYNEFISGMTTL